MHITIDDRAITVMTAAYLSAVEFTDTGDTDQPDPGTPFSAQAHAVARRDCEAFLERAQQADLLGDYFLTPSGTWDNLGIDFWLTRNGHGAGFWDRGLGALGDKLTLVAKAFGSQHVDTNEADEIGLN